MSTNRTPTLTAERLREVLDYCPATGVFRWKVRRTGGSKVGAVAGGFDDRHRYLKIKLDGVLYSAHRLAWLYMNDVLPSGEIDHINGAKTDNRIANLREASTAQNTQNADQPRRNNKSGYRGVTYRPDMRRPWLATICLQGKVRRLGFFDTAEQASAAYIAAKRTLHPFWVEPIQQREDTQWPQG